MVFNLKNKIIKNPILYRTAIKTIYRLKSLLPDKIAIKKRYKRIVGTELDLNRPQSFNEKIQWLKLYWRKDICTICADKFEVRKYVEDRIGKEVINELYGVYKRVEDIDISKLPDSFVLKVTHGSGQNILCRNKNDIDWKESFEKLQKYLLINHFFTGREWAYKNIIPRIICEKYLDEDGKPPKDYKIFCFNGVPKIVQLDVDRFNGHKRNMYDTDWNILDFEYNYSRSDEEIEKPIQLAKMIEYATKLSENIPFVRVDFYYVNGQIYFGEMTFHPENGEGKFNPKEYNEILGSYLELPTKYKG